MDIMDVKLANKFAKQIAAGFSRVEVDGMNIIFTLNDGTKTTLTVPTPKDGVSVIGLEIDEDGSLLCTLSNGTVIDAGGVPFVKPERGVDYWTEEDQAAIKDYINKNITKAFYIEQDDKNDTLIFRKVGLN